VKSREDEFAALLRRFLTALDHAAKCPECVVDLHTEARNAALNKLKQEARVALGRRPN
jgi:hypothetical protein